MREASWQGRSGGLDRSADGIDSDARESLRLKKKAQRGELPPLSEVDSTPVSLDVDSFIDGLLVYFTHKLIAVAAGCQWCG